MTDRYILSLDVGTSNVSATLLDHDCNSVSTEQKPITHFSPHPGWSEEDPEEIWRNLLSCITNILIMGKIKPVNIAGIGISNQRETTIIWNRHTGKPIHRALVWESRQTEDIAKKLISSGYSNMIHEKTGLFIDSYFSATKITWLLSNVEGAQRQAEQGDLLFGTLDTWIIWKLTNGHVHVTDYTNASRTMLFNIETLEWDQDLLTLFNIPKELLPEVKSNSEIYGYTDEKTFFNAKIPIAGIAGDQQAALFGRFCTNPGDVVGTYGTGAFIIMNTGSDIKLSDRNLLSTIAYGIDGKVTYALEGSIFVAGAAMEWLKNGLEMIDNIEDAASMADQSADDGRLYVVPAFTGLSAPYWDPNANGASFGITQKTTKYDYIRATLESIAYQTTDIIYSMKNDTKLDVRNLYVNGGVSTNNYLIQFQSNISGIDIYRQNTSDADLRGVGFLTGLAVGFWDDLDEIKRHSGQGKLFTPEMPQTRRRKLYRGWQRAIRAVREYTNDID
ncbi:glycerol kinase GlpK [Secundilactobacillus silagei]|uniref:Glycerol kinase n=1 Tax=Secundilactobacillus silagei JCM 19001 TaxID=1302250 RepID=A0A1Z5IFR6_9LACO|nr:glycerol kinase GlpK [Secundilactobacillus silagei]TDG72036.1 hypothetical protein C5L25_002420 [Secundilactobacillus silagei JCM 19001]GAX00526.1 glycerol kinase [Secundilactobacillus silagei JCM 19001]